MNYLRRGFLRPLMKKLAARFRSPQPVTPDSALPARPTPRDVQHALRSRAVITRVDTPTSPVRLVMPMGQRPAPRPDRPDAECHYCQKMIAGNAITKDHIVPRALGGRDAAYNYVPACTPCNQAKAAKFPTCVCETCLNAIARYQDLQNRRYECHYCELLFPKEMICKSRIVPRSLGGRDGKYNFVPGCEHCVQKKAANLPTCRCDRCAHAIREAERLTLLRSFDMAALVA